MRILMSFKVDSVDDFDNYLRVPEKGFNVSIPKVVQRALLIGVVVLGVLEMLSGFHLMPQISASTLYEQIAISGSAISSGLFYAALSLGINKHKETKDQTILKERPSKYFGFY